MASSRMGFSAAESRRLAKAEMASLRASGDAVSLVIRLRSVASASAFPKSTPSERAAFATSGEASFKRLGKRRFQGSLSGMEVWPLNPASIPLRIAGRSSD